MPRSLWKGAISFGLIYVPVELHTGSRDNTLPLHLLDSRDFAPIRYVRVNKRTGKEVDWGHIVKGYEYKQGDFVALADADGSSRPVGGTRPAVRDAHRQPWLIHDRPNSRCNGRRKRALMRK